MAARYFKVKYDFSTNEARNKCNTSFSCYFDWAIHFLYYFGDLRSSSRSKVISKVKNKMAARYFKVKYDCSTNEARNKCNTALSCDFDQAIHFLHYFHYSRSSSRSKRQSQGQLSKITILTNEARNMCNTSFSCSFVWPLHIWNYLDYSRSSSKSRGQFQGKVRENIISNNKS